MTIYEKKLTDDSFKSFQGKHFEESWYTHILTGPGNGYYLENGIRKILFKFHKNLISSKYSDIAIKSFLELSKKKHSNRGIASGIPNGQKTARHITKTGQNEGNYIASNISGYFDRPLREHRGILGTIKACRTTAFTLNNSSLWNQGLPFIKKCSKLYKEYSRPEWNIQKKEWDSIKNGIKIPDTVFTTITSNYNWRTACHKDSGDYPSGLGNLVVLGNSFTGGYLGFPQFKVLIKIEPGDFLLMDVHQWHCNTPIKTKNDGFRLSFVMYIRESMSRCKTKRVIGSHEYFL
jgi:hypothetical protein